MTSANGVTLRFRRALFDLVVQSKGRLFRKYAALLVALVGSALIVSAATEGFYSYFDHRDALVAVQREKAIGAATAIEQFVREIEGQVGWTTHASFGAGQSGADQRRFDFLRLLRQAPAITEVAYLDAQGREQLKVSRLAMDVSGSGLDRSSESYFQEAKQSRRHVSPVYFRKESEPYLSLAISGAGRNSGVTVAEVNLKFIWDVVSRLKVGKAGTAYVIDGGGLLIAHPDIGLVLRKTDLSRLEQVIAARALPLTSGTGTALPSIVRDPLGREVLSAFAPVAPLGWTVFVELPVSEAFEPLYASLVRSGLVLLSGLVIAALVGLWLAQRMVVPIRALADGAARIGAGDLDHRLNVKTGDEVEKLADGFNEMGARLKLYYAGLEQTVAERTREVTEALEYQTATSDVLGVISRSPSQIQPVLDAIVLTAARLCAAEYAFIAKADGDRCHLVAGNQMEAEHLRYLARHPVAVNRGSITGRVALERQTIHVPDVLADPEFENLRWQSVGKQRTVLGVPLLRESVLIGVMILARTAVAPFSARQIELVTSFADQAVIAINNVQLFEEVQARTMELARSVNELEALGEVGRAVSSTLDLEQVLETVVTKASDLGSAEGCTIFRYKESDQTLRLWHASGLDPKLEHEVRGLTLKAEGTMMGKAIQTRDALQVADIELGPDNALRRLAVAAGFKSALFVPLMRGSRAFGVLVMQRRQSGPFDQATVSLLKTFASQSTLAIQNARLFREIEDKGEQLAIASRHKSQFLANMSHELRTPLNAVLGYTELIQDGIYGAVSPKIASVLDRVQSNGRHLLGLINDVLDLSKIEAGQLELGIGDYSLQDVVKTVVAATEPLAAAKKLPIKLDIAATLPVARGDERRISQVLLNLLGNAIKFTDAGEIRISAVAGDDCFVVSVSDTGPGIAASEQARIFEEFHQVDNSNTKAKGGTGLGLAISRRIIEMHGGRISVSSVVGNGSTFKIELPVRVNEKATAK